MLVKVSKIKYTAPYTSTQTSFAELGAPAKKPSEYIWREAYKDEIKAGLLDGKTFKYKHAKQYEFVCHKVEWVSNKRPAIVHYKLGTTLVKDVLFYLDTEQYLTSEEKIDYLISNLKGLKEVIIPTSGCSLHGDIDVSFIMEDATEYTVPYNY